MLNNTKLSGNQCSIHDFVTVSTSPGYQEYPSGFLVITRGDGNPAGVSLTKACHTPRYDQSDRPYDLVYQYQET